MYCYSLSLLKVNVGMVMLVKYTCEPLARYSGETISYKHTKTVVLGISVSCIRNLGLGCKVVKPVQFGLVGDGIVTADEEIDLVWFLSVHSVFWFL